MTDYAGAPPDLAFTSKTLFEMYFSEKIDTLARKEISMRN
jgi:hypothetical protein